MKIFLYLLTSSSFQTIRNKCQFALHARFFIKGTNLHYSYLQFTSSPCDLYCRKPAFNDQRPIKINEVSLHEIIAWGMSHILNIIPKLEAIGIVRKFPWNNVSGITINVQANERCYNIQYTHWNKLHNLSSRYQQIQTLCRLQNFYFNHSFWKIIDPS